MAETAGFTLLITTDQHLQYQQDLATRRIAIIVLTSTSWPRIRAVAASVAQAVNDIAPFGFTDALFMYSASLAIAGQAALPERRPASRAH